MILALLLAAVAKLGFASQPGQVGTGVCSPAVVIEGEDAAGAPAATVDPIPIIISGPAAIFPTSDCTGDPMALAGGLAIPSGGTNAKFYFLQPKPGSLALGASASQFSQVTQTWTVVAALGVANGISFIDKQVTVALGACSAALPYFFHDVQGTAVAAPRVLNVIYQPAQYLEFYSDAGCATRILSTPIPSGGQGGQVYVKPGTVAGAFNLQATSPGFISDSTTLLVSDPKHGCASAGAGWAALAILLLPRRRSR
jgi:hypothetical protein